MLWSLVDRLSKLLTLKSSQCTENWHRLHLTSCLNYRMTIKASINVDEESMQNDWRQHFFSEWVIIEKYEHWRHWIDLFKCIQEENQPFEDNRQGVFMDWPVPKTSRPIKHWLEKPSLMRNLMTITYKSNNQFTNDMIQLTWTLPSGLVTCLSLRFLKWIKPVTPLSSRVLTPTACPGQPPVSKWLHTYNQRI